LYKYTLLQTTGLYTIQTCVELTAILFWKKEGKGSSVYPETETQPTTTTAIMKLNNRVFLVAVAGFLTTLGQALVITDGDGGSPSDGRSISAALFSDLEELARLVDISYCVGSTGVYNPFKCLSHCDEFEGFELVTVSLWIFIFV
jgi:hypothetical protein